MANSVKPITVIIDFYQQEIMVGKFITVCRELKNTYLVVAARMYMRRWPEDPNAPKVSKKG